MKTTKPARTSSADSHDSASSLVTRAARLADEGHPAEALKLLARGSSSAREVVNARGVCFMRMDKTADAVRVFRSLVLPGGSVWMNPELPVIYRTNFATALLLAGLPLGVRDTLGEISETAHPSVIRLRGSVRKWEQSLSWRQRLGWKFGLVPGVPMTLDFPPGEFVDPQPATFAAPPDALPPSQVPVQQVV